MLIKKVICDKCNAEIGAHSDKITLFQYFENITQYGRTVRGYKAAKTLHLCKDCKMQLYEFMNIKGEEN